MKKIYLILCLFMSSMAFAQAPLLTEDFDYTAADALTLHGWRAHSGGTTAPQLVTSPGLIFAGYVGSDKGLSAGVNNNGQDVNKRFAEQTSGSIYTSFLVNATLNTGGGGVFFHMFDSTAATAFRARTFIIPRTGKMRVGFSFNASAKQDSISTLLNFGETYLFVVKYTIVAGAENDIASLYVFKAGADFTTEPATPSLGPMTATRTTPGDISTPLGPDIRPMAIALRQFETAQKITVDGFRVKTTWELTQDTPNTGINDINKTNFDVYPNPVSNGLLNINFAGNSLKYIEIFDLVGKKIRSEKTSANTLDVRELKSGLYLIKVNMGNKISTSKFTIK